MLLNLTWLVPGLPIIASALTTVLLLSFTRTMNRLTKPVSYFLILSVSISEIIDFILFKKHISGIALFSENFNFFSNPLQIHVDNEALQASLFLGFIVLSIMLLSFLKLNRRAGYVRYFIMLGFLGGFAHLFLFSGTFFHKIYDPLLLSLGKTGLFIS